MVTEPELARATGCWRTMRIVIKDRDSAHCLVHLQLLNKPNDKKTSCHQRARNSVCGTNFCDYPTNHSDLLREFFQESAFPVQSCVSASFIIWLQQLKWLQNRRPQARLRRTAWRASETRVCDFSTRFRWRTRTIKKVTTAEHTNPGSIRCQSCTL